nr:MAG TPA: hypothetical protein [Bacteriophage sp.]
MNKNVALAKMEYVETISYSVLNAMDIKKNAH